MPTHPTPMQFIDLLRNQRLTNRIQTLRGDLTLSKPQFWGAVAWPAKQEQMATEQENRYAGNPVHSQSRPGVTDGPHTTTFDREMRLFFKYWNLAKKECA